MKPVYTMWDGQKNIVGYAMTMGSDHWGEPALLTTLYVIPKYRGLGHGPALLKAVCKDADREHKDLVLSLHPDPEVDYDRYAEFFRKEGFEFVDQPDPTMYRNWKKLN